MSTPSGFRRIFVHLLAWWLAAATASAGAAELKSGPEVPVQLPAYQVRGNPVEDFGFRVSPDFDLVRSAKSRQVFTPVVDLVLPNTAASKAGIRPGDRIVAADGKPAGSPSRGLSVWQDLQSAKWKEAREAVEGVKWTLSLEATMGGEVREVTLQLPTPAPRWGAPVWQTPLERPVARVSEAGPLAERAQQILDNGIWMLLRGFYVTGFGFETTAENPHVLGYQWTLWDERGGHRMFVTRQRDRTEIVLEFIARPNHRIGNDRTPTSSPDPTLASGRTVLGNSAWAYFTSPAGELSAAIRLGRRELLAPAESRAGFDREVDFWLQRAGKASERWPLEVRTGGSPVWRKSSQAGRGVLTRTARGSVLSPRPAASASPASVGKR